jgi:hypothetical protein
MRDPESGKYLKILDAGSSPTDDIEAKGNFPKALEAVSAEDRQVYVYRWKSPEGVLRGIYDVTRLPYVNGKRQNFLKMIPLEGYEP